MKIIQFFGTLLVLLLMPQGWSAIGQNLSALTHFYLVILFLEVYAYCWPILRMAALPPQVQLLAKWLLRLQIMLIGGVVALAVGIGMYEAGWEVQAAIAAAVSVFLLLPLLQEVFIRSLAARREDNEASRLPAAGRTRCWQMVIGRLWAAGSAARAAVAVMQDRNWLGIARVARVTGASFGFACIAIVPMMAAFETAYMDEKGGDTRYARGEAWLPWFWGLVAASFVFGVVFDAWFIWKRRRRARANSCGNR